MYRKFKPIIRDLSLLQMVKKTVLLMLAWSIQIISPEFCYIPLWHSRVDFPTEAPHLQSLFGAIWHLLWCHSQLGCCLKIGQVWKWILLLGWREVAFGVVRKLAIPPIRILFRFSLSWSSKFRESIQGPTWSLASAPHPTPTHLESGFLKINFICYVWRK